MTDDVTKKLSELLSELSYDDLNGETISMAKACILDALCCNVVGSFSEAGSILSSLYGEMNGRPESSIIGYGYKVPALNAALTNGTMIHAFELDDYHAVDCGSSGHFGGLTLPVALSLAERDGLDGRKFILSIVAGYEVGVRVYEAFRNSKGWHSTGTAGTFAAAAVAAKILKLNVPQTVNAFGLAGTQAAGLSESYTHVHSKPFHTGKACYNGMLASMLARKGFLGSDTILEGERGFGRAIGRGSDYFKPEIIVKDWGKDFAILKNSFKLAPVPGGSWQGMALHVPPIVRKHTIEAEQIERVEIGDSADWMYMYERAPVSVNAAKFSADFIVAASIVDGQFTLEQLTRRRLEDSTIQDLMRKVEVKVDPKVQELYKQGHYPLRITIILKGGRQIEELIKNVKGYYLNPITWDEIKEKFLQYTAPLIPTKTANSIISFVENLDDKKAVSELIELIRIPEDTLRGLVEEGR